MHILSAWSFYRSS